MAHSHRLRNAALVPLATQRNYALGRPRSAASITAMSIFFHLQHRGPRTCEDCADRRLPSLSDTSTYSLRCAIADVPQDQSSCHRRGWGHLLISILLPLGPQSSFLTNQAKAALGQI